MLCALSISLVQQIHEVASNLLHITVYDVCETQVCGLSFVGQRCAMFMPALVSELVILIIQIVFLSRHKRARE
jgi:hypothetical protein